MAMLLFGVSWWLGVVICLGVGKNSGGSFTGW